MPAQRKVFRIEQMAPLATPSALLSAVPLPQQEILAELHALRELIERRPDNSATPEPVPEGSELQRLRQDTESIYRAINHTKRELASVQVRAFDGKGRTAHVARQLDAVAEGAEHATQRILDAAEEIEDSADTLVACLKREQERALAHDIRDHAVRIFEACNFQDLSGQRINKVIATLEFVEERIARMMAIWGDMDAFESYTAATKNEHKAVMLHGPKLEGDAGHVTQADVDQLFAPDRSDDP